MKFTYNFVEMMLQKRSYPMFSTIYMKNKLRNGNPGKKFKNYKSLKTKKIKMSTGSLKLNF